MRPEEIKENLVEQAGLSGLQADLFLLITREGPKSAHTISGKLGLTESESLDAAKSLVEAGALIEMPEFFEAMHPRFTMVNMYRRMCQRTGAKFGRNKIVDEMGALLEAPYEDARTK